MPTPLAPNPTPLSTRWKATFVGLLVLAATIVCSAVLHSRAMNALRHEVEDKLLRIALAIAAEVDGDLHQTFTDPRQETSPEYARALQPLDRALSWKEKGQLKRNDYRYIYTCTLVNDQVHFILDPTPSHIGSDGIDEKSHIMQPYPEASEKLRVALRTGAAQADNEPYRDQWGTFVSGYAPFFDSAGKLAGAVGVDWYAETYAERLAGIRRAWYLQIVLCLVAGFISGVGTGAAMVRHERVEAARRHAIDEERRNRERWRIMVETLPKPAAHLQDGELWVNEPLIRTMGWSREQLASPAEWFERLFQERAAEEKAAHEAARAAGFHQSRELRASTYFGQERWLEFTGHGYGSGEVWLLEDITEKKEHQQRLIEAREQAESASRAKDAFLATVSHEIRTPMNGVIGMTNMLLESRLDPRQRELAETVSNCAEALVVVINDILDYSKIESGGMELESEPFDLRACVEDCLHLFSGIAASKGVQFLYEMPPDCPAMIRGDSTRFRQILCNLIGNAVKFTERGEVSVHLKAVAPDALAVGGSFALGIEVRDTGIGIPADRMDRLFRRFSQVDSSMARKYGGTGLGLAISRRLAELMGGKLEAFSELGKGSTFTLTLATQAEAAPASSLLSVHSNFSGVRVLLVESHGPTAQFIEGYLRQWGIECSAVPDAEQALRQLRDFGPFRLLITALQLPGADGLDLCRQAAVQTRSVPKCLLLSTLLREDIIATAREIGIAHVLLKPLRPAKLLQEIEAALRAEVSPALPPAEAASLAAELPLRILVVEDNPVNQLVARHSFTRLGYPITLAADGEEAVAAAQAAEYDVIFMDLQMPKMNGFEATERIRALPSTGLRPWIVALTAGALETDQERCLLHGMDDYISKPLRLGDIERALRAAVPGEAAQVA
ncbi:MAG: response regulator [Chthoniobacteraceae bacterium]